MAEPDEHLAKEWVEDPSQCATFLAGLIREFESLFIRVDTPADASGESWQTVERTKTYKGQLAIQLAQSIRLAKKALSLCESKNYDTFKIKAQWQAAFQNVGQKLMNQSVVRGNDKQAMSKAMFALEEAFTSFESIVTDLNKWIRFSITVSNNAATIKTVQVVESPKRSPYAEIEDALDGQSLKLFQFLAHRKHPTAFDTIKDDCPCFRESSEVTSNTVFEALKRLRSKLSKMKHNVSLNIEKPIGRTQLIGLDEFKSRGKTGGK